MNHRSEMIESGRWFFYNLFYNYVHKILAGSLYLWYINICCAKTYTLPDSRPSAWCSSRKRRTAGWLRGVEGGGRSNEKEKKHECTFYETAA